MKLYLFIVLFLSSISGLYSLNSQTDEVALLSYPRSGNTWTRYCIESVTHRNTQESGIRSRPQAYAYVVNIPISESFDLRTDITNPSVLKCHSLFPGWEKPLILLLRNPKECIMSHYEKDVLPSDSFLSTQIANFYKNIRSFDNLSNEKLLIYYEDLIQEPQDTLKKIASFLSADDKEQIDANISSFMDNYKEHRENCKLFYSEHVKTVTCSGKLQIRKHSSALTSNELFYFENKIRDANPALWDKYLKRYETHPIL